jgi:hypothetical protein
LTEVLKQGHAMPTADQMATIRYLYSQHMTCCRLSGVTFSPKHHLTCHLVHRTGSGSPHPYTPPPPPPPLPFACLSRCRLGVSLGTSV